MNYHQGDVFLEKIVSMPKDVKFVRKDIVAYGEITGHKHQLIDSLFYEKNGEFYLKVITPNKMTHEEHPETNLITPGNYKVRIQKEYFPEGFRNVAD